MNDEHIERMLRRYRPAGPPASLRGRSVDPTLRHDAATGPGQRWAALAAAALVALALGTYQVTGTLRPRALAVTPESAAIAELAAWMGGRPEHVALATDIVWRQSLAQTDEDRADVLDGVDR